MGIFSPERVAVAPRLWVVVGVGFLLLVTAGLGRVVLRARFAGEPVGPALGRWLRPRLPDLGLVLVALMAYAAIAAIGSVLAFLFFVLALSALGGSGDDGLLETINVLLVVAGVAVFVLGVVLAIVLFRFVRRVQKGRQTSGRPLWPPSLGDVAVAAIVVAGSGIAAAADSTVPAFERSCEAPGGGVAVSAPPTRWEPVALSDDLDLDAVEQRWRITIPWLDGRSPPCSGVTQNDSGGLSIVVSERSNREVDELDADLDVVIAEVESTYGASGVTIGSHGAGRIGGERSVGRVSMTVELPPWWLGDCEPEGRRQVCRAMYGALPWTPETFPDDPIPPHPRIVRSDEGHLVASYEPIPQDFEYFTALDRETEIHESMTAQGWTRADGQSTPCYFRFRGFDDGCSFDVAPPPTPYSVEYVTEIGGVLLRATYTFDEVENDVWLAARVETASPVP